MRAILASTVPLHLKGLRATLESTEIPKFHTMETFQSGRELLDYAEKDGFDLALVEFQLEDYNGLDVCRELLAQENNGAILLILPKPRQPLVKEAVEAGIRGVVHVECSMDDLSRGIQTVLNGKSFLCPVCTTALMDVTASPDPVVVNPVLSHLTPREREVLQLLAEGNSSREAGDKLNISHKTVDTHRRHIMRKLDADSLAELVKTAIRTGLVTL